MDPLPTRAARTSWRRFAEDGEVVSLVHCVTAAGSARAADSLERLLLLCRPVAAQLSWSYSRREEDVADMAQEALLYVTQHLADLREPAAFPHWFAAVVHSTGRQWLRRQRRHAHERSLEQLRHETGAMPWEDPAAAIAGAPALERVAWGDTAASGAVRAVETLDVLRRLLRVLAPREREALVRFYLDDLPQREISQRMEISAKAVEDLIYRALRRLRMVAAQCGDEMEELLLWCPSCGGRRLRGRMQPGDALS